MPGPSFSIPAQACKFGSALRKVEGSVCSKCYALKGRYTFSSVKNAQSYRLSLIDSPDWVDIMVEAINKSATEWFRWHDAGDLQSYEHLLQIIEIAKRTPEVKHWLPTKEYGFLSRLLQQVREDPIPPNLNIRLSMPMIGENPKLPPYWAEQGVTSSTVGAEFGGWHCPAYTQGGKCGECRACWNKEIPNVDYPLH